MEEVVNLHVIPKEADRVMEELANGNMIVARSKNDFLYIIDFNGEFHMFSHTPGAPGGGQKRFTKDEKYVAVVRNLTKISDFLYMVEFDKNLNLYGVMSSAETAILDMFPGENRDADGEIEFVIPDKESKPDEDPKPE